MTHSCDYLKRRKKMFRKEGKRKKKEKRRKIPLNIERIFQTTKIFDKQELRAHMV